MELIANITDVLSRCFVYATINIVIYQLSGDIIYYVKDKFN